ncbi:lycopene cyclase domain-containing protein [Ruicaihuangia caeni]|uniref:Lycopene cyclase domain-containing protein n=1 Tax=Ruicaihuangia caeni TaxID=3042517 RepID=A0AAW6T801_9MICO|nr:lycopene cyclase domain-containing protein [Klugiella sp. YN-L-19]MDI2098861.1 lycopene cyclase domain-containing protein [Klugiella sp. YN-L-19]
MSLLYLALLLISLMGSLLVDARFSLFLWREPRRAAVVLLIGFVFFLTWDLVGIGSGVFLHLDSAWSSGILVAPHLPIEELVFLLFFCHLSMVLLTGSSRLLSAKRERVRERS